MRRSPYLLWGLVFIQGACAAAVLGSLLMTILGFEGQGASWRIREALEIAAALGLVMGTIFGIRFILHAWRQTHQAEQALRAASGAFAAVVDETFSSHGLTAAQTEVAWLIVKGFSVKETADLRGTSQGTVKSQCNAIYSKMGVTGRAQLLSYLVEDLLLKEA